MNYYVQYVHQVHTVHKKKSPIHQPLNFGGPHGHSRLGGHSILILILPLLISVFLA